MYVQGLGDSERFRIVRRLGEGGMGVVYEADDREREQRVALKTFKYRDSEALYRFKREFRTLADLAHPNLVELYDLVIEGGVDGAAFFTMELIEGIDVVSYCRGADPARPHLTPTSAADLPTLPGNGAALAAASVDGRHVDAPCDERRLRASLRQLAGGLHALHRAGKLHRDVKPSNVLVTPAGRVVVLDFGLATDIAGGGASNDGRLVGTPEYMSPEQAGGELDLGPESDWYAVGVLMYEALTGRVPFAGPPVRVLMDKLHRAIEPPSRLTPTVHDDLDALCTALLARDSARRPAGDDVLARLGGAPVARGTPPPRAASEPATTFTGRDDELARLAAALAEVDAGHGARAILVEGPSGIGKSSTIREFLRRCARERDDVLVIEGRCFEREDIPYKAIDSLVDNLSSYWRQLAPVDAAALLPRQASYLPRLFPVLGRVPAVAAAPEQPRVADPRELRTRAYAAFRELVVRLGDRARLVLYLDDMQWVDADTVALLADVLRAPDPPDLLLVMSARPRDPSVAVDHLAALTARVAIPVDTVELGPLPRMAAIELAARLLGDGHRPIVERVAAESLGSPFFLGEIARYLQSRERDSLDDVRLDDVLMRRVNGLPDDARRVLEIVCLAGEPIERQLVMRAAGLDPEAMTRQVRSLRATSFVRSAAGSTDAVLGAYHDTIREVVAGGLDSDTRARHHRGLALALSEHGGDHEQLARHWYAAGEPARAARHARRAAARAAALVDFDRAAELYRMALLGGSWSREERRELAADLAETLAHAGRPAEAADAYAAAADLADPATRLELRRRGATELLRGGYLEAGLDAIAGVLGDVGMRLAPSPRHALASLAMRRAWLAVRGLGWRPRRLDDIAPATLTRVDVCWSVATGLAMVDHIRGGEYQSRHLSLALRVGEPVRVARALALEAAYRAGQGAARAGTSLIERAEELAASTDDAYARALVRGARGMVTFYTEQDWRASLADLEESETMFRAHYRAAGWEVDTVQYWICINLLYLGELDELARRVPAYIREAERRGDRYAEINLRSSFNLVRLMSDHPDEAERDLEDAIGAWSPVDVHFSGQHIQFLVARCRVALYRGDVERAHQLLETARGPLERSLFMRAPWIRTVVGYLRGRVAILRGDRAGAAAAARALARVQVPMAAAYASALRAGGHHLAGDHDRARGELERAAEQFDAVASRLFAASARRALGRATGGREGASMIREADAWMDQRGVRDPAALAAMLVVGWD